MEGRPARRGRVLLQAWKVVLRCDDVRPSSHGKSPGITIPDDLRDLDERPARDRSATCHACHVRLPDDDAHGSSLGTSILQAWKCDLPMDDASSSMHGRSSLHASQITGRDNEHHSSLSGRSSRPATRIGPDRFDDRHGYSGSPNLIASLVACIACRAGIEGSLPGQRRLASSTTKPRCLPTTAGGPPGKARCPTDRRSDLQSSKAGIDGHARSDPRHRKHRSPAS